FEARSELALLARVLESEARALDERSPKVPPAIADVVDRCLRKQPADRFASAGEMLAAIDHAMQVRPRLRNMTWWRTHQLAVMGLYAVAATIAWNIKESFGGALALWLFVALGIMGAIGGIVRGHLLFTERMNQLRLVSERRRTARATLAADLAIASGLF